jgi:hypothetical protein
MHTWWERLASCSSVCLRCALGLSWLSAVADRCGWWGALGQPHVAWAHFAGFVAYTGQRSWCVPHAMIPARAALATCAERWLGLLRHAGWHTRSTAACRGVLLLTFGRAMTLALGMTALVNLSWR